MKNQGMTLIELLVTIAILIIVLAAVFTSYLTVLKSHIQQSSIAETNIEKAIALEILRKDIEMAGFGLPWYVNGTSYSEADTASNYTPDPSSFNDAPGDPPRGFAFSDNGNTNASNSDVLVIKSSIANIDSKAAKKWGYAYYSSSQWNIKSLSSEEFNGGDYYIALTVDDRKLTLNPSSTSTDNWHFNTLTPDLGNGTGEVFLVFGIDDSGPSMPFNRVDYYLKRPDDSFPDRCNPDIYELYRAEINQGNGKRNPQPILDCVADFQLAFGLDTNGDGIIDSWGNNLPSSAEGIRTQVKQLAVYIIYQEGQKEDHPIFSQSSINISAPDGTTIKSVDLTNFSNYQFYRWKLLQMRVNPLNLAPEER